MVQRGGYRLVHRLLVAPSAGQRQRWVSSIGLHHQRGKPPRNDSENSGPTEPNRAVVAALPATWWWLELPFLFASLRDKSFRRNLLLRPLPPVLFLFRKRTF